MPDEQLVVRGIDWKSAFPFTLIFRSFRVAIHPSKLVLALLALLLIYLGGRVLDGIWPAGSLAVPGELQIYMATRSETNPAQEFRTQRAAARQAIVDRYDRELRQSGNPNGGLGDIKDKILKDRQAEVDDANTKFVVNPQSPPEEQARVTASRDRAIESAYATASARYREADAYRGIGLFRSFLLHEIGTTHLLLVAGASGDWLGTQGVMDQFVNLLTVAPGWAMRHHPLYFSLFGIYFLVVWAIFGGAISRIAAVQVARDEKISFRQALSFSTAKFLSFVSAPIIPLAIIACIGLVVWLGSLILFLIPFLGPILVGILFFLVLAAAFIMTLVLLGLLGGFNLMYPTIAVEGSDSFDAISRSFSYLFARPWRLVFYSLVAAIYGTFCYAFVRYFIKLMLSLAHTFVGMGVFRSAGDSGVIPLWPVMWPDPLTSSQLSYNIDFMTLSAGQSIGAFFLAFWVYLTLAVLGAFTISFYFSANTIIYILMRHEVDATEMDDVYLEQTDEDFGDTGAAGTEAQTVEATDAAAVATTAPADEGAAPTEQGQSPSGS